MWENGTYTLIGGPVAGRERGGAELFGAGPGSAASSSQPEERFFRATVTATRTSTAGPRAASSLVTKGRPASDYEGIGMTADMSGIFFTAPEPYLSADRDDEYDVYAWQAGDWCSSHSAACGVLRVTRPSGGPATAASSFCHPRDPRRARPRRPGRHLRRAGRADDADDSGPRSDGERLYGEVGTVPGRNGAVTFTVDCGRRCDQSGIYWAHDAGRAPGD